MNNFARDIEAATSDPILCAVIGHFGGYAKSWSEGERDENAKPFVGKLLAWEKARPLLDYAYDTGYGGADCHAVTAWTANSIVFVTQYDGSTSVDVVPRNPVDYMPEMFGGG